MKLQEEAALADIPGMNVFAAIVILTRSTAAELVDCPEQDRLERFSRLVGYDRIVSIFSLENRR